MRDLILKMSISIDGFVSDLDGTNTWMFGSDQEFEGLGRRDHMERQPAHYGQPQPSMPWPPFWPTSTMEFAPPMNQIPKAVFSRQGIA